MHEKYTTCEIGIDRSAILIFLFAYIFIYFHLFNVLPAAVWRQGGRTQRGLGGRSHDGVPQDELQLRGQGEQILLRPRQRIPPPEQSE